ncbi:MAG: hypothetical protein U1F16_09430 [Turneriella sp.]
MAGKNEDAVLYVFLFALYGILALHLFAANIRLWILPAHWLGSSAVCRRGNIADWMTL